MRNRDNTRMPPPPRTIALSDLSIYPPRILEASVRRDCTLEFLERAESSWAPWRRSLAGRTDSIEHSHWNWRNKRDRIASGFYRLVAIECVGETQGLMAVVDEPLKSRIANGKMVYIDFLETAPWNLAVAGSSRRFAGVGTALLLDAIRLSWEHGSSGRVGLHSLPQAERLYERIGMAGCGADSNYYDLVYIEFETDSELVKTVREELS